MREDKRRGAKMLRQFTALNGRCMLLKGEAFDSALVVKKALRLFVAEPERALYIIGGEAVRYLRYLFAGLLRWGMLLLGRVMHSLPMGYTHR